MNWRPYIKAVFIILYSVFLCVTLPLLALEFRRSSPTFVSAWFIGGLFVLGAVPISLWTILDHLIHYNKPYLQRHIIRECYEAYVIYNFLAFLLNYLRHEFPDFLCAVERKPQVNHLPPFCCLKPWVMGRRFIDHCRHGALQYTVIRPITTVIALICELLKVYGEGDFNFRYAFVYLTIINNVSQIWAMYCLILFYRCTKEELRPMKPVLKFICVKFVVFMSFWQSILIFLLAKTGVFKDVKIWEIQDVNTIGIVLQNFAICIEMFFASLAHHVSFSHLPYMDPNADSGGCCTSWWSMWDVSDMRRDICEHLRHVGSWVLCHRRQSNASRLISDTSDVFYPDCIGQGGDNEGEINPLLDNFNEEHATASQQPLTVFTAGGSTHAPTTRSLLIDQSAPLAIIH